MREKKTSNNKFTVMNYEVLVGEGVKQLHKYS